MPSHRLSKLELGGIELYGYSEAGEETVVGLPQFDVCFDIGKAPAQLISINHCLLTHGHMDHAAGFAYYLSHKNFSGQKPGILLAPENLIPHIEQILDSWGKLDGNEIPRELKGIKPGDEYQIKPNIIVRAFGVRHCRGALGYSVIEIRNKLKSEYAGLSGRELVALKEEGKKIDYRVEIPLVTYLGDTEYIDLTGIECARDSKILITECTFYLDKHVDRAKAGKHLHIKDLAKMAGELNNEYVVITHLTQRTPISQAKKIMKKHVPEELQKKIVFLMDRKR